MLFDTATPSKEIADLLVSEWLEQWRPKDGYRYKFASPKAQKISKVTSIEHSLIETIKYGSKVFTEPDLKKKGKQTVKPMIYAYALDNILVAMKGKKESLIVLVLTYHHKSLGSRHTSSLIIMKLGCSPVTQVIG